MSLIEYTFGGKVDKVKKSIERIRAFEPIQNGWFDEPYYVCYSGGKDSDAIRILFELSGVPFELWHSHTTADAPETVRYVRSIQDIHIRYPTKSMWQLIAEKMMPPSRTMRYCCGVLKESGGEGRFVVTGVRWQESKARKRRGGVEVQARKQENALILNADNDESRRMIESCQTKGKRVLNPIIDWSETDVWELLRHYGCKGNPLYAEGKKRVGCVGCPMAGTQDQTSDFQRWPKYRAMYIRAFDRMVANRKKRPGDHTRWENGEDVMRWWLQEKTERQLDGQMRIEI